MTQDGKNNILYNEWAEVLYNEDKKADPRAPPLARIKL